MRVRATKTVQDGAGAGRGFSLHPVRALDGAADGEAAGGLARALRGVPASFSVVLDEDPDLTGTIEGQRAGEARRVLLARTLTVHRGAWEVPAWPSSLRGGIGLLVLDGLLSRRLPLGKGASLELLGAGDVLRPWDVEDADGPLQASSRWSALTTTRLAVLDTRFARALARFPEVTAELVGRLAGRVNALSVGLAIAHQPKADTRLQMMLWHLAQRWGRVGPDGVLLSLPLTQQLLADLVGMRRPSVTQALRTLEERGAVSRTESGWLLLEPLEPGLVETAANLTPS